MLGYRYRPIIKYYEWRATIVCVQRTVDFLSYASIFPFCAALRHYCTFLFLLCLVIIANFPLFASSSRLQSRVHIRFPLLSFPQHRISITTECFSSFVRHSCFSLRTTVTVFAQYVPRTCASLIVFPHRPFLPWSTRLPPTIFSFQEMTPVRKVLLEEGNLDFVIKEEVDVLELGLVCSLLRQTSLSNMPRLSYTYLVYY